MFFESIKIFDGRVYHLEYHQQRVNRTLQHFKLPKLQLKDYIDPPQNGLYKLKFIYYDKMFTMQYTHYKPKIINSFGFVECDKEYAYKYLKRDYIDNLNDGSVDEVILTKEGYITDTTIANIAFYDGNRWLTPKIPLLQGSTRQRYIDNGLLHLADIKKSEIDNFQSIALMNAMIGFYELKEFTIKDENVL